MAATITGIVFDDLNHNGIYDVGEPPIPNAYVVRQRVGGGCVTVQTDAFGVYTFSNINLAGTHIIYETAVNPGGACPPTLFGQPPGFTNSTTFRTETINLTQNDIDNNVTINANNYGHDNPDTFFCAPFGYQVAATGGNSQFVKINLVTGTATVINPDIGFAVNAIGYNVLDNMIYGIITQGNVGNVVRIAEDGTTTDMGTVTNLPAAGYFIGSFDNAGHLFVYISNQANYYVIDLDQNSPYFGQLVDPTGGAFTPTASGKPIINPIAIADWAYNVLDGQLYALENSTFTIQTIDPLTGIVTPVPTVGVLPTSAGASFMDGTGTLYEIYNPTGDIYRVTFSGGTATGALFSQTVTSTGNDGASCHDAEVIIDFGDAPDTGAGNGFGNYSTLLANNGPRHQIINPLTLGTQVTGEQDALQNSFATGDDIPANIPDDGVILPLTPLTINDTSYSFNISASNDTGLPANLYVWIDFNQNGIFEGNEAAQLIIVPTDPVTNPRNFTVTFNNVNIVPPLQGTYTFVRARLTTETLVNNNLSPTDEDTRSIGPAEDGEVEDYLIDIAPFPPTCPMPQSVTIDTTQNASGNVTAVDPQGYPINYSVANGPFNGNAQVNILTGDWTYVPNPGFVGVDTFDIVATVPLTQLSCSTSITVNVVDVNLTLEKETDKTIAQVGDEITYTIKATNTGTTTLDTAVVQDTLPANTTLKPNSTFVDGALAPGADIESGIELAPMIPGQMRTIVFTVIVGPGANPGDVISNSATAVFGSELDGVLFTKTTQSNVVDTTVVDVNLEVTKSVDLTQVVPGGILTYTLSVTNTGSVALDPVIVTDTIPAGTTVIPNTVTVDNVLIPGADIEAGVDIGPLGIGVTKDVEFQVRVDENLPPGTVLTNVSDVEYSYTENNETITETATSNEVDSTVDEANLTVEKIANREGALVGDTITYTLIITNSGNLDADNVTIQDPLSQDVQFDNNIKVDGNPIGGDITVGVNIGTVPANSQVTVTFDVIVVSVPDDKIINNIVTTTYEYSDENGDPIITETVESNEEQVRIFSPEIEMTKEADKENVEVGDTFTYTIRIENTGDIKVENFVLQDTLPPEFSVEEIKVDGNIVGGDLAVGIPIGDIDPGQIVIVEITVLVNELLPTDDPFKNVAVGTGEVVTDPNFPPEIIEVTAEDPIGVKTVEAKIRVEKSSNVDSAVVGDTIIYTIKVTNEGDIDLDSVIVSDPLSPDLDFIEGSLKVNGVPMPMANILTGVEIGPLAVGQMKTITFEAKVISKTSDEIINVSTANFTYILNPGEPPQGKTQDSNENIIELFDPNLTVEKMADKEEVSLGDVITFTVVLTNDGDTELTDIVFKDELPQSLELIDGTFEVNGVVINGVDLDSGINVGSLMPGESIIIKYQAKVVGGACSGIIKNNAFAEYKYILPDGTTGEETSESSSVEIEVNISIFKQITLDKYCQIPCQKPPIEEIDYTSIDVKVINSYVIATPKIVANEGQILSGFKLILHGVLKVIVEYTADIDDQAVHSAHYDIPFSSFIILPPDYKMGDKVEVSAVIESADTMSVGPKEIFINAAILLVANIPQ